MLNTNQLLAKGFLPYHKKTLTFAKQMKTPFSVQLETGEIIHGKPGDFACVSPDDGGRWIVDREVFEKTYSPVPFAASGTGKNQARLLHYGFRPYRKHQITWAKKLAKPAIIHTLEGDVAALPGDYLCIGPNGDQWPQKAARFEAHYERVAAAQAQR